MKNVKILLLATLLFTSVNVLAAEPLTVAIASNLKYVFDDLATEFKRQTGIEVQSVLNSSGKIATQVRNGAPFDIFMAADMEYPEGLYKDGYASMPPQPYAYGLLVLWTKTDVDLSKGVTGLVDKSVGKVAIANPKVSPFGRQTLNVLKHFKVLATIEPKLVYGESITQVSHYVDSKVADVGFSTKSIVIAPETVGKGKWIEVPPESYEPMPQGVVILKHGSKINGEAARKFYGFLQSTKARAIFAKNGYKLP
jgi:molybdate transport system substrate-binding protein